MYIVSGATDRSVKSSTDLSACDVCMWTCVCVCVLVEGVAEHQGQRISIAREKVLAFDSLYRAELAVAQTSNRSSDFWNRFSKPPSAPSCNLDWRCRNSTVSLADTVT